MTTTDVVERARRCIGHGCIYGLGHGGMNPGSLWPWNLRGESDCSGFVSWCLGVSRHTSNPWYRNYNGGWLETTAIVRDATTPFGFFDLVAWVNARPGHLIVYPDRAGKQGHIGVVATLDDDGPATAVHCSKGNWTTYHDAIQETGVGGWRLHDSIVVRCAFIDEDESAETAHG